jgi:hypothetical protein
LPFSVFVAVFTESSLCAKFVLTFGAAQDELRRKTPSMSGAKGTLSDGQSPVIPSDQSVPKTVYSWTGLTKNRGRYWTKVQYTALGMLATHAYT